MEALVAALNARFGTTEGTRLFMTVIPGIISDFKGMAEKVQPGGQISEEYRLDDGSAIICLTGKKDASGEIQINAELL